MIKRILSANIVTLVLLLSACSGGSRTSSHIDGADTIHFEYASNIKVLKNKEFIQVELRNPWDTLKTLQTYILVNKNKPVTNNLPKGTVIKTPLRRSVVYSSVHCALLDELDAIESISGVCDLEYINHNRIKELCDNGHIADCGSSMNPDIEKIIDLNADAVLLSPFENSGGYGRIESIGIPIIECADYMETSPLGRAEWIKFYGMLIGKEKEADSLFNKIEEQYQTLKAKTQNVKYRPTVISELKYSSAWYVPGGQSTMARLINDAGANYIFSYTKGSGSIPLSFETVLDKGQKADFWLIKYNQNTDKTYSELENDYSPYKNFDAWKNKRIFGCNTSYVNYYEETPFHPESLLRDLIIVFHPELMNNKARKYFTPIGN